MSDDKDDRPAGLPTDFLRTHADEEHAGSDLLSPGETIGPWRIVAAIAKGGMGEVYRVRRSDGAYEHDAALKVMRVKGTTAKARFSAERQRLAELTHPGVTRIIDGGDTADGLPYMVMELIEGAPIDAYAASRQLDERQKLNLIQALCEAVSHAHANLVLHRDIKPGNILVDKTGTLRLIDFGISASLEEDDKAEQGSMTLAYASPEQIAGRTLTVATDIFSIGLTMAFLLTGNHLPRTLDGDVDLNGVTGVSPDLLAIMKKALAPAPEARYSSAEALRRDIDRYQSGFTVSARDATPLLSIQKLIGRHPIETALASFAALAVVAGLVASLTLLGEARRANAETQAALDEAEAYLDDAGFTAQQRTTYANILQQAAKRLEAEETFDAILLEIWREADAASADDPDEAALVSYTLGRHFLFKNDFNTALIMLNGWLSKGYGDAAIIQRGELLVPIGLMNTGRHDEAIPYLRRSLSYFEENPTAYADHIAVASRLAIVTSDPDDVNYAIALIEAGIEEGTDPPTEQYFWGQLANMYLRLEDRERAYGALESQMALALQTATNTNSVQVASRRIRFAQAQFFHQRDLAAAEAAAQQVLADLDAQVGESRTTGVAHLLLARVALARGEEAKAAEHAAIALPLIDRFAGKNSMHFRAAHWVIAEAQARQGNQDAALIAARAAMDATPMQNPNARAGMALHQSMLNDIFSENSWPVPFPDAVYPSETVIRSSFELTHLDDRCCALRKLTE